MHFSSIIGNVGLRDLARGEHGRFDTTLFTGVNFGVIFRTIKSQEMRIGCDRNALVSCDSVPRWLRNSITTMVANPILG